MKNNLFTSTIDGCGFLQRACVEPTVGIKNHDRFF